MARGMSGDCAVVQARGVDGMDKVVAGKMKTGDIWKVGTS